MDWLEPPGSPSSPDDLRTKLGRGILEALESGLPHVRIAEVRRDEAADVLVLDIDPEVPQEPAVDIRREERVAVLLSDDLDRTPRAIALRRDFPRHVPHLNLPPRSEPWADLCLYEMPWHEVRAFLTPAALISRVHEWLSLTARGELHAGDQPLEPFLAHSSPPLILPSESFGPQSSSDPLRLLLRGEDGRQVVIAASGDGGAQDGLLCTAVRFVMAPRRHGPLHDLPATFEELHEALTTTGFDLTAKMRTEVRDLKESSLPPDVRLVLILATPLLNDQGNEEGVDLSAFLCASTLRDVGEELGVWTVGPDGQVGMNLPIDSSKRGQGIKLLPLRPMADLSPSHAAEWSGLRTNHQELRITAIGVGALGSQLVANLVRTGFGTWCLIDDDVLLPHNVVRHHLMGVHVGFPKADCMALMINHVFRHDARAQSVVGDALSAEPATNDALDRGDLILDTSASVAVSRHLALRDRPTSRCVSIFLNPAGSDLVALVEDGDRRVRLHALEAQYYRALLRVEELRDHLELETAGARYGQGCRDVTGRIPQEQVAVAAGIAARAVRTSVGEMEASATIWRMDEKLAVRRYDLEMAGTIEWQSGSWRIVAPATVLDEMHALRRARLPNETGGVLLGFFDFHHKVVCLVQALPAPPDSVERPVFFERGSDGLRSMVTAATGRTGGSVTYVGEWHSHPGTSTEASELDADVFEYLRRELRRDGQPPFMMIVGEDAVSVFLGELRPASPAPREATEWDPQ